MKSVIVKCEKCNGSGKVPLDPALEETFKLFTRVHQHGGVFWTVQEAFNSLFFPNSNFTVTAINNRLEKLRKLGLIERRRNGRAWEYFKTKGGK
jgi:hypothetical protein